MKKISFIICLTLILFGIISLVSAKEFRETGVLTINAGDKIILDDTTIEIKEITNTVNIQVGEDFYNVGFDKEVAITPSISVKTIAIFLDKRATFWVQNRKTYRGDGNHMVISGDTIIADNGYGLKINRAVAPYIAWHYNFSLISPEGDELYTFAHTSYDEVPVYSNKDKTGEIVLYLFTNPPSNKPEGNKVKVRSSETKPRCPEITPPNCPEGSKLTSDKTMDEEGCPKPSKCTKTLSNGRNAEIKIMPQTASAKAIEKLGELDFTIEIKEVGSLTSKETRAVYELTGNKQGRFLGIFKIQARVQAQVDTETGEVIKTTKPWWAFLATGV
jgi:hypothetical protein